jgi:hypothetical protein
MNIRLQQIREQRLKKYKDFLETDSKSWKKRLKKMELDILDLKIKIEKLKAQYE